MKVDIRKIIAIALGVGIVIVLMAFLIVSGEKCNPRIDGRVIASNYVGYDFARAVLGGSDELVMLTKPGIEIHDYEPTPEDIRAIQQADLLIYIGGESEGWVERLINGSEIDASKTLRLMDYVEVKPEEIVEGMDDNGNGNGGDSEDRSGDGSNRDESGDDGNGRDGEDDDNDMGGGEDDEHIWTSPVNAKKMVMAIADKLAQIYPEKVNSFKTDEYIEKLTKIDEEFRQIVARASKDVLIFGDRFPFRYFVDEYGLKYYAAFPGCAEQTEANGQTIGFLIDKAREIDTHTILKIELSSGTLAQTIADEVGAEVLTFNSAHNISKEDFDNGKTYVEIMEENTSVLEEALR